MKPTLFAGALVTMLVVPSAFAFENLNVFPGEAKVQRCYGMAMVGMDSVINSRLGVPPEHAVELARLRNRGVAAHESENFSTELLDNILHAYLWEQSPHSYAIRVFYQCAQKNAPIRSAEAESVGIPMP